MISSVIVYVGLMLGRKSNESQFGYNTGRKECCNEVRVTLLSGLLSNFCFVSCAALISYRPCCC